MKGLMLFPCLLTSFQIFLTIAFLWMWIQTMQKGTVLRVKTTSTDENNIFPLNNDNDPDVKVVKTHFLLYEIHYFYLVMYFWWMGISIQFGRYVVASATASWYFTREKSVLNQPVRRGMKYCLRYHFGSLVFGTFLVVICVPFKYAFNKVQKFLERYVYKQKNGMIEKDLEG